MGTRLLLGLAALGALIGLAAVVALEGKAVLAHGAETQRPIEADLESSTVIEPVEPSLKEGSVSSPAARTDARRQDEAPVGRGVLIVKTFLDGEPHDRVRVDLRSDTEPVHVRKDTEAWAFSLPARSAVILDITDQDSGWIQTETTLAPTAGDVQTLTVELTPPVIDGDVMLQVRSDPDGHPIVGARVVAISETPPDIVVLSTDGGGSVRVPRGPGFSYVVSRTGYGAVSLPAFAETQGPFKTVTLRGFARLFGTIQTPGGRAASVQLMSGDPASMAARKPIASATVDEAGAWSIEGITVPVGQEALLGLWVELEYDGAMRTLGTDLRIEPSASVEVLDPWRGGRPTTLEFVYPSGTTVAPGTKIFLRREAETEIGSGESVGGVTDEEGCINFPALFVGTWACEVGPAKVPELIVTGDPMQSVRINDYDCIAGRVRRTIPSDQPLPVADVFLRTGERTRIAHTGELSGGQFRFDFVPTSSASSISASIDDGLFTRIEGTETWSSSDVFSSGKPIEVLPGTLDVTLSLSPMPRADALSIKRKVGSRPDLTFDK